MAGKNIFNAIKLTKPSRSQFDLSHDVKLSFNMGELIPVMCTEAVPGDSFNIGCESLLRFAPLVAPVMHRMDVYMHYFFVPNRLLWDGWEDFITAKATPAAPFTILQNTGSNYTRLMDYFGIPSPLNVTATATEIVSALPFAAYQKIYDEYYRDQNLVTSQWAPLVSGDNTATTSLYTLRTRAWEHDYFTAALPFAQAGSPVSLPLGEITLNDQWQGSSSPTFRNGNSTGTGDPSTGVITNRDLGGNVGDIRDNSVFKNAYDPDGSLSVQATTINDLRRAFRLQEWLEKSARGGRRYIEHILSHFGVHSSDKRLQRPEYITGTKSPVQISEVLNTTGTTQAPQGEMAGHGISVTSGKYGNYFCEEHGYIIGIMSVMPKTAYQQGIPKHFTKVNDPFQYYWPAFANIGEQPVENRELYAFQATGMETFGYVPRYAEYKFENNRVAGDFRTTLDFWHLGRIFATQPALNQQFIQCDPTHRVFAVTNPNDHKMWAHVYNKVMARRPMPKFGTPMM